MCFLAHTGLKVNCNGKLFDLEGSPLVQSIENMNTGARYKQNNPRKCSANLTLP